MSKQNDDQAETEKSTLETTQEAEKKQAKDLNEERSAQLSRRDGRSQLFSDDLVDDLSEAVKDGKLTYEKDGDVSKFTSTKDPDRSLSFDAQNHSVTVQDGKNERTVDMNSKNLNPDDRQDLSQLGSFNAEVDQKINNGVASDNQRATSEILTGKNSNQPGRDAIDKKQDQAATDLGQSLNHQVENGDLKKTQGKDNTTTYTNAHDKNQSFTIDAKNNQVTVNTGLKDSNNHNVSYKESTSDFAKDHAANMSKDQPGFSLNNAGVKDADYNNPNAGGQSNKDNQKENDTSKDAKSSFADKGIGLAAGGGAAVGLTKLASTMLKKTGKSVKSATNSAGRSMSSSMQKMTQNMQGASKDPDKSMQKDFAKAGVMNKGDAAAQASM